MRLICVILMFTALGCKNEADSSNSIASPTPSVLVDTLPAPPSPGFQTRKISVGGKSLVVEIADTDVRRAHGLMFRQSLGADDGMLFVFDDEKTRAFWMRNTRIPLSIAYIDKNKKIVDIQDMQPALDSDPNPLQYPSRQPAMYALEMNLGWFARNNVKVGDALKLH